LEILAKEGRGLNLFLVGGSDGDDPALIVCEVETVKISKLHAHVNTWLCAELCIALLNNFK